MVDRILGGAASGGRSSVVPLARRTGAIEDYRPDEGAGPALEDVEEERRGFALANLIRVLLKWRWLFLGILLVCAGLGSLSAYLTTPMYRAAATLELNPAPAKVVQLGEPVEPTTSDRDFLALQVGLVKSRAVAERVARNLDLRRDPAFTGVAAGNVTEDAVVGQLMRGFTASGTTSDRLMQLNYAHPNPGLAAKVVNAYADSFIESNIQRQFDTTAFSRSFLQKRLAATREKLEQSERDLMAYARQANILNIVSNGPEGASSTEAAGSSLAASNLMALNQQLAEAQNGRMVAQQRYQQASAAAASARVADPRVQALEQQRAQLEAEYQKKSQTFKPDYPDMVALKRQIDTLSQQVAQASSQTGSATSGSLRAEYVAAVNRERALEGKIAQLKGTVMDLGDKSIKYTILKRDVDSNRSLYNSLLQRLKEEDTSATKTSNVAIVDRAQVPGAPFEPNIPRSITLSLLLGLVLGTSAAFGAEYLDDTVKLPEDLRDRLDLAVIGVIPKVGKKEEIEDLLADPASTISEAYYSVRTALQFSTASGVPKSLLITSSRAAEGKTSSSLAIARDFASLGLNVLLIDADLRNPSLLPETRDHVGFVGLLTGHATLDDAINVTETKGLYLLPAGPIPPNPANLLAGSAARELISKLAAGFDVVVVDGPPVLGLADAPLLAAACDATMLVVEAGKTRRALALNALSRLRQGGANIIGGLLTKFNDRSVGYGYGYGYGGQAYTYRHSRVETKKRFGILPTLGSQDEVKEA